MNSPIQQSLLFNHDKNIEFILDFNKLLVLTTVCPVVCERSFEVIH